MGHGCNRERERGRRICPLGKFFFLERRDVEVKSWGTGGGLHSQQLVQIAMLTTKVVTNKAIKF
jgi:hypothetical protein